MPRLTQNEEYVVKTKLKNPESAFGVQNGCFVMLYMASNELKVWSFPCFLTCGGGFVQRRVPPHPHLNFIDWLFFYLQVKVIPNLSCS